MKKTAIKKISLIIATITVIVFVFASCNDGEQTVLNDISYDNSEAVSEEISDNSSDEIVDGNSSSEPENKPEKKTNDTSSKKENNTSKNTSNSTSKNTSGSSVTAKEKTETDKNSDGGLSKDFKAAMDSYEKFMDEYVSFMKKYKNNPTDASLLTDYSNYMSKYSEFIKDFQKWQNSGLNSKELSYYLEVQTRVSKKLLEIT